jgi:hypothetical protein
MGFSTAAIFDWKWQADDSLKLLRKIVRQSASTFCFFARP